MLDVRRGIKPDSLRVAGSQAVFPQYRIHKATCATFAFRSRNMDYFETLQVGHLILLSRSYELGVVYWVVYGVSDFLEPSPRLVCASPLWFTPRPPILFKSLEACLKAIESVQGILASLSRDTDVVWGNTPYRFDSRYVFPSLSRRSLWLVGEIRQTLSKEGQIHRLVILSSLRTRVRSSVADSGGYLRHLGTYLPTSKG